MSDLSVSPFDDSVHLLGAFPYGTHKLLLLDVSNFRFYAWIILESFVYSVFRVRICSLKATLRYLRYSGFKTIRLSAIKTRLISDTGFHH